MTDAITLGKPGERESAPIDDDSDARQGCDDPHDVCPPADCAPCGCRVVVCCQPSPPAKPEPEKTKFAEKKQRADDAAKLLAGSFAIVATILTALGATSGGLERMLRNHPGRSLVAFVLLGLAIGIAIVAYILDFKNLRWERGLLAAAGVLFTIGLLFAIWTAVVTPSVRERPRITASFTPQPPLALQVAVKAQGVTADTPVGVTVEGLQRNDAGGYTVLSTLYTSFAGPDGSGVVDFTFAVPVPAGSFEFLGIAAAEGENTFPKCDPRNRVEGCTIVKVPQFTLRPALNVQWSDDGGTLLVDVTSRDLSIRRTLMLLVYGKRPSAQPRTLYRASLVPDGTGAITAKISVPVPAKYSRICVAAATELPDAGEQPHLAPVCNEASLATTWVRALVPSSDAGG